MKPVAFVAPTPPTAYIHPGRVSSWRPDVADVLAVPTSGMQAFILRELIDGPRSTAKLIERVYLGAREPEDATGCIHVTVWKLNKKLRPGWHIDSEPDPYAVNSRGRQTRYVLRRVP